jgi:hypothetical protein
VTILPASRTPTIAVRTVVVALAFSIPLVFGVWGRLIGRVDERPSPTTTSGERLLLPTLRVPFNPSFTFTTTQPGSSEPVAFDPCRPIRYVVRPVGAPPDGNDLLSEALERITEATGLEFVDAGTTDEVPVSGSPGRANFQPDRYGDEWAPVLIAWSTPAEYAGLAGPVIGETSTRPVDVADDQQVLVSGQVTLDAQQIGDVIRFAGGRSVALAVITHELGHLVGLGHVTDPHQLMYPSAQPLVTDFGPGDLTGLAALGNGRCFDNL